MTAEEKREKVGDAVRKFAAAVAALVDGRVVLAIDAVVVVAIGEDATVSRINLGPYPEAREYARNSAVRIYAGEGTAAVVEHGQFPIPPRNN